MAFWFTHIPSTKYSLQYIYGYQAVFPYPPWATMDRFQTDLVRKSNQIGLQLKVAPYSLELLSFNGVVEPFCIT